MRKIVTTLGLLLILKVPIIAAKSIVDGYDAGVMQTVDTFQWRMDRINTSDDRYSTVVDKQEKYTIWRTNGLITKYYIGCNTIWINKNFYSFKSAKRHAEKHAR